MLKSVLDGYVLVKELMPIGDPICNSILANRETYVNNKLKKMKKSLAAHLKRGHINQYKGIN
jgi:hypothetical protein